MKKTIYEADIKSIPLFMALGCFTASIWYSELTWAGIGALLAGLRFTKFEGVGDKC